MQEPQDLGGSDPRFTTTARPVVSGRQYAVSVDEAASDRSRRADPRSRRQRVRRRGRGPGRARARRPGDERVRQRRGDPHLRREDEAGRVDQRRGPGPEARDDRLVQSAPRRHAARRRLAAVGDGAGRRRRVVHAARPLGHDEPRTGAAAGHRDRRTRVSAHARPRRVDEHRRQAEEVPDEREALSPGGCHVARRRRVQEPGCGTPVAQARRGGARLGRSKGGKPRCGPRAIASTRATSRARWPTSRKSKAGSSATTTSPATPSKSKRPSRRTIAATTSTRTRQPARARPSSSRSTCSRASI